jgi:HTH-type transcriptional regulator/antitoxin HigA
MAVAEPVTVPVIRNSVDYEMALTRLNELADMDDSDNDDEVHALGVLISDYEQAFPIDAPDPIDAIKFRMAQMDISQADLARELSLGRGRVSELLNRKRLLPLNIIRALVTHLGLPPAVLIQAYEAASERDEASV